MDCEMQMLAEMGISLTELAVRGTASIVSRKIQTLKNEKNSEKIRTAYDSIINEVLQEREEAVRIAQAYKGELEKINISDKDIEHLHATVSKLIDIIKELSPNTSVKSYEMLKDLISVDTLKAMQLLGFNYKLAIGEPLTELCANAIYALGKKKSGGVGSNKSKR